MPKTTVVVSEYTDQSGEERTQYRTTIPKSLAEAFELEQGQNIEWSILSGNACRVEFADD